MAMDLRTDAGGYNPYRGSDGKFASGPHKERLAAARDAHRTAVAQARDALKVARATAKVARKSPTPANRLAAQVAANRAARAAVTTKRHAAIVARHSAALAKQEKRAAVAEARQTLVEARAAAKTAKASPTVANQRAAQVAANRAARAAARVDRHTEAVSKRAATHAEAKAAHAAARDSLRSRQPVAPKIAVHPKAEHSSTPHEPLSPTAAAIAGHVARGDFSAANQALNQHLEGMGLSPALNYQSMRGTVHAVPADLAVGGMKARGLRHWNGLIEIRSDVAAEAGRFASQLNGVKATALHEPLARDVAHLEARSQAAYSKAASSGRRTKEQHRAAYREAAAQADAARARRHGLIKDGESMRTFVHESLHGFSPIDKSSYRQLGAMVEEVTTEAAARRVTHELFGHPIRAHDEFGASYYHEINAATQAVAAATGRPPAEAFRVLQDASLAFKRRSSSLHSDDEAVSALAEDIAHHARKPIYVIEPHLRSALERAAKDAAEERALAQKGPTS